MNKLIKYLREAREELAKVTWPTKRQTLNYSIAVVAISVVIAVFIGAVDYGFNLAIEYVIENKAGVEYSGPEPVVPTTEPITSPAIQVEGGDVQVTPVEETNQ